LASHSLRRVDKLSNAFDVMSLVQIAACPINAVAGKATAPLKSGAARGLPGISQSSKQDAQLTFAIMKDIALC
jgi:hypothetical protein